MRMTRLVYLGLVMLVSMLILPLAVSAQGNAGGDSEAAAACQDGGYLTYTDTAGNAFTNAGQCTSYAARGGELVPVRSLHWEPNTLSGTGFTPNTDYVVIERIYSPSGLKLLHSFPFPIDEHGSFSHYWNPCDVAPSDTSFVITVTDAAGLSHTASFAFSCS